MNTSSVSLKRVLTPQLETVITMTCVVMMTFCLWLFTTPWAQSLTLDGDGWFIKPGANFASAIHLTSGQAIGFGIWVLVLVYALGSFDRWLDSRRAGHH